MLKKDIIGCKGMVDRLALSCNSIGPTGSDEIGPKGIVVKIGKNLQNEP